MFQAQNRETINSTRKVAVSFKIIDNERQKIVFHITTPDLQDQDHSAEDQDKDRLFGIRWSSPNSCLAGGGPEGNKSQ